MVEVRFSIFSSGALVNPIALKLAKTLLSFGLLKSNRVNPYKSRVLFVGYRQNSADPDQTPQNMASDQGLHCLLTVCSIKFKIKI